MSEIQPLAQGQPLHCPSCAGLLCTVTAAGAAVAVPGTFYGDDGDCIPESPKLLDGLACGTMAMVGKCPHCTKGYWGLEVFLHEYADTDAAVLDMLSEDHDWDSSFVIPGHSPAWTAHAVTTDFGPGYVHIIGPMAVADDAVTHGANGVSACGGGGFWQHALATFTALQLKIETVQRALAETVKNERAEGLPQAVMDSAAEANTGSDAPNLS